jgi:hypothetical protein
MIEVADDFNVDKDKARKNLGLVAGLAKKIFGCSGASWGSQDIVLFDDPSRHIATIYPQSAYIELRNPLYAEEARRFGEAFETAFGIEGEGFLIYRKY